MTFLGSYTEPQKRLMTDRVNGIKTEAYAEVRKKTYLIDEFQDFHQPSLT